MLEVKHAVPSAVNHTVLWAAYASAMSSFADRIGHVIRLRGETNASLARAIGISKQAVGDWVSGKTKNVRPDNLVAAARHLRVRIEWLAIGESPMEPNAEGGEDAGLPAEDYTFIQLFPRESVALAAGAGRTVEHEVVDKDLAFLSSWLRKKSINPSTSRMVQVAGDSMASYLMDGDVVLIDTSDTTIRNYKVYALRVGDETRVKRLYRRPDGTLVMHSDNPGWTPREEPISEQDLEAGQVVIIGRMRWRGGEGDA